MIRGVVVIFVVGCSAGMPKFEHAMPPPLAPVGEPHASEEVRVELRSLPWWTVAGTHNTFILGLPASDAPPTPGRRLGAMRTTDIALSDEVFEAVRCAWMIVPMGESRPCAGKRADAKLVARDAIEMALAELRAKAGDAGVNLVADVRCFATTTQPGRSRLWCEGMASAPNAATRTASPALAASIVPANANEQITTGESESPGPNSRLVLHADGSFAMLGRTSLVTSTLGLRYRPIEFGIYIVDLTRGGMGPLVGVGGTALGRFALGDTRLDAIAGVSAVAVAPNGAVNPSFDGLYHGFVGVAYQTPWRWAGWAQPFIQLRAGVARGTDFAPNAVPMVDLHIGLSTPERR